MMQPLFTNEFQVKVRFKLAESECNNYPQLPRKHPSANEVILQDTLKSKWPAVLHPKVPAANPSVKLQLIKS